jgi:hypothetical protein
MKRFSLLSLVASLFFLSCSPSSFKHVSNGFRTIGLGMTRPQVIERLQSDPSITYSSSQPVPNRLNASTTLGRYSASLIFDFTSDHRLYTIRIGIGETGFSYVDDQAFPYFWSLLKSKFGEPKASEDAVNEVDLFTWQSPEARRTLATLRYPIPTGHFCLILISDPKEMSPEETALRKWEKPVQKSVTPQFVSDFSSKDF